MASTYEEIEAFLKAVRFRYKFLGGVDEEDVWRVFEQLHEEYVELLKAQHQYHVGAVEEWRNYAVQLQERIRENDAEVKRLRKQWNQLKQVMQKEQVRGGDCQGQAGILRQNEMLLQRQRVMQRKQENTATAKPLALFSANNLLKHYGEARNVSSERHAR